MNRKIPTELYGLIEAIEGSITQMANDLKGAKKGNRDAAQRVRTGTIKLEKIAKDFRKESMKVVKKE